MKFIVDKEIDLSSSSKGASNDLLHTKGYADILLQSVKDAPKGEPYTIGLFGEWGSGKSSVIKTMTDSIDADQELKKVKVVTYDAWKYAGDSFRRMFLYELRNALGMGESPLMQRFYVNETHETKIKTSVNWKKVGIVVAFVLLSVIAVWIIGTLLGKEVAIPSTVALIALLFSLYSFIFDQLKVSVNKPLLFAPEQFEACYKEMVGCATKWDRYKESALKWITLGLHHEQYLRLVIVVDNIDRCQADKAYTLLTDIKNFLCKEFDVIFIVPVDIEALRKHIIKPSSDHQSLEADEFLRKFFNTSIWMKPFQNDEMYDFANNIAKRNGLDFKPDTISLVANEFATNPRRIIQLFNNLQIELSMYPRSFAEEHQALICKLLIIREEFSAYYKQLLTNPVLIFKDVALIRAKGADRLEDEEKTLMSDSRLFAFLLASTGVSSRYESKEDVVHQILVNSQTGDILPENIRQAYRTAKSEEIVSYARDDKKRDLLLNYLQDNIKKMVKHQTIDAEGKTHIDVLLALFDNDLLTADDKKRLFEPIESSTTLSKIVNLYKDKQPLIRLGNDLETLRLPKLTACLESNLKYKDITVEEMTTEDTRNVFYAASIWPAERCKNIREQFLEAIEKNPAECHNYVYDKAKYTTLFTGDVYKHIFDKLSVDDCSDERSTFQTFSYLCHLQAINKKNLLQFINKAIEIAPTFDRNNPQRPEPTSFFKVLSEIFNELHYLGRVVPLVTMTQLFDKINGAVSVSGYNSTVTHSYVTDNAGDERCARIISQFFTNANLITDGPVISNAEIERFMEIERNRDIMLDALMYLKEKGINTSTWTNAIISDPRRTDVRRVELLKFSFVKKNDNDEYEVNEDIVKREMKELINFTLRKEKGTELIAEMMKDIIEDERIDRCTREILSRKGLDELKLLPEQLMKRAISSFEVNADKLSIPGDSTVLQLLASLGSPEGRTLVWEKINPILADGSKQNTATINAAVEILLTFSALTNAQNQALAANIAALKNNKLNEDKRNECIEFLAKLKG